VQDGLRAVGAPDLDGEMLHSAIVGAIDMQPPGLRRFHRQTRGGDGQEVVVRRKVLGRGVGGEAGEAVVNRRMARGVADRDGQHAGQKLR
jgi:hypothetical protein